jgi:hypothetical protein
MLGDKWTEVGDKWTEVGDKWGEVGKKFHSSWGQVVEMLGTGILSFGLPIPFVDFDALGVAWNKSIGSPLCFCSMSGRSGLVEPVKRLLWGG